VTVALSPFLCVKRQASPRGPIGVAQAMMGREIVGVLRTPEARGRMALQG
jgi:hypothetical protein